MTKSIKNVVLAAVVLVGMGMVMGQIKVRAAAIEVSSPVASASSTLTINPTLVPRENLTEPQNISSNYRLESVLDKQKVGQFNVINGMRWLVRVAVDRGVAANTIVFLLLLPLIATVVAVLHYVFGLTGYGIFTPTMIAITLMTTGIFGGLLLFALILLISVGANWLLKRLKLHFWPARSISLVLISLGTFGLMIISSFFKVIDLTQLSIFSVLFMILLAEDFVRTQLVKSKNEAKKLTIGTLVLSIAGAALMSIRGVQETVLLYPEVVVIVVIVLNLLVGSYGGIRLSEISRFKKAMRDKPRK